MEDGNGKYYDTSFKSKQLARHVEEMEGKRYVSE